MLRAILLVAFVSATAGACYSDAGTGYGYDPAYSYPAYPVSSYDYNGGYGNGIAPSLAYLSPGVQVLTDYDYPVFFADNLYWRWYGGLWYSSPYWNRGWGIARGVVPVGVRGIAQPWAYAHYRPFGGGYYHGAQAFRTPAYRGGPGYRGGAVRGGPVRGGPVRGGAVRGGGGGHGEHR